MAKCLQVLTKGRLVMATIGQVDHLNGALPVQYLKYADAPHQGPDQLKDSFFGTFKTVSILPKTGTGQVEKKNEEQGAVFKDTVRVGRALTAQSQFK